MCPHFRSDKYRITDIGNRTGDPHDQTLPGYRKSDIGHQSESVQCPMSEVRFSMSIVRCLMSLVWGPMSEMMSYFMSDFLYEFSFDFMPDFLSDFVSDLIGHEIGQKNRTRNSRRYELFHGNTPKVLNLRSDVWSR